MKVNLVSNRKRNLLEILKNEILECKSFYFTVSFIRYSGVQILLDILKEAETKGTRGRIITTNYMGITERRAVETLLEFKNLEIRYIDVKKEGFHPKGYIFDYLENKSKIIIGSSNLSIGGLKANDEWSTEINATIEDEIYKETYDEFMELWSESKECSLEEFENIRLVREEIKKNKENKGKEESENLQKIEPNFMQISALENLEKIRNENGERALGIAATGSGKTYMAAFDVQKVNPKTLLYIAHREEILERSKESFSRLIPDKIYGKYVGKTKHKKKNYIFGSIQSIVKNLDEFPKDKFEYIIIDEAHHLGGETYQKVLNYFEPKFLLGLTATPERTDGYNIYEDFHNNVISEIRLKDALENNLIAPFHYFGITDIEEANLENIDITKVDQVAKKLMINKRTDYIIEKIDFYKYSGSKMKGIGFCANKAHAKYMAEEFNKAGIKAIALVGEDSQEKRQKGIRNLEDKNSDLKFIFTVDIFNEGIDIPSVNLVLMLRPTSSPIIFIQQLGRGLRKSKEKEFVTIIDFIGNHNKVYLIALALMGNKTYDKDHIKHFINTNFISFAKNINISMDEIIKERILAQIEAENFNGVKYLREEYYNFKNYIKKIPSHLDYLTYESAPNIYKFVYKYKSYYKFLESVEDGREKLLEEEYKIIEEIERLFPCKRLEEVIIIKLLLENSKIKIEEIKKELKKYLDEVRVDTVIHSVDTMLGKYLDDREKLIRTKLIELETHKNEMKKFNFEIIRSESLQKVLENLEMKKYLTELIDFGIKEYESKYQDKKTGLKLFETYSMREVALLSNYKKIHSSYRNGINISEDKKTFYLFINLEKEQYEKFKYNNIMYNNREFAWYTKSSTSVESDMGQRFVNNKELGIKLEFFIRKFNKIDNITEPFVYVGRGDVISYTGEKPIKCRVKLDYPIRDDIYQEFIK